MSRIIASFMELIAQPQPVSWRRPSARLRVSVPPRKCDDRGVRSLLTVAVPSRVQGLLLPTRLHISKSN